VKEKKENAKRSKVVPEKVKDNNSDDESADEDNSVSEDEI